MVTAFVAPNNFTFADSLLMLSIVILGGLGNVVGLIPAAIIVLVLPERAAVHPGVPLPVLRGAGHCHPAVPSRWVTAAQDPSVLPDPGCQMSDAMIEVRNLTMRFGGLTALDNLQLDIRRGEVLGLLGPNGSGKTTFFNVLTGLYRASAGTITYNGENVIGKTPQDISSQRRGTDVPALLLAAAHRIRQYRDWRLPAHAARAGVQPVSSTGIPGRIRALCGIGAGTAGHFQPPLVNRLFEPVESFTMIDRRRIEVCRALMSRPRLLLLDEPSAGMTHDETHELMDDILQVRSKLQGMSVVLIEHERQRDRAHHRSGASC